MYGNAHGTATHCHTLQHTATHCNTLQHTLVDASSATDDTAHVIQMNVSCCARIRCWVQYTTRQHIATHCNTLQHTATHTWKEARVTSGCVMDASGATHDKAHVIQMNASCCVWMRMNAFLSAIHDKAPMSFRCMPYQIKSVCHIRRCRVTCE